MKYSWLVGGVLSIGMVGHLGGLAGAAPLPRPIAPVIMPIAPLVDGRDRVLITPKTVILRRGKLGADYPLSKTAQVQYPQISGIKDPALRDRVQAAVSLKTVVGQSFDEIKLELQENYWLTDIHYAVNYNQNFLLDLTYTIAGMGAYPSVYERHVTIDLKTGRKVRSHDLFKREFLGTIAAKVNQLMQADIVKASAAVNEDGVALGCPPVSAVKFGVKQVDDFGLSAQGVTFRYNFGFPHVRKACEPAGRYFLTYAQLKSYIRPDGPIGPLLK